MIDRGESSAPRGPDAGERGKVPRVSIIIATWNAEATLRRCLRSIVEQGFKDWELLIADGASADGTLEILREFEEHLAWWDSAPDKGIYDAWNKALVHAVGEYVCFLGADDRWIDENAIERLFDAIGNEQYDLVSSRGWLVNAGKRQSYSVGAPMDFKRLGRRIPVCHPGLLHRRQLFQDLGQFDASYRIAGDLDFLLRIPTDARTLHVDAYTVEMDGSGVSRENVGDRIREQRRARAECPRFGPVLAYIVWLDKLWRWPIARLFDIPH